MCLAAERIKQMNTPGGIGFLRKGSAGLLGWCLRLEYFLSVDS